MNKLKIFGLLVSAAGFLLGLVASSIEDKKMEEAVEETVARELSNLHPVLVDPDSGKEVDPAGHTGRYIWEPVPESKVAEKMKAMKNAGYTDEKIENAV